ncbi:MAG TPA: glyoxalase, partial [Pseudonocardiaceae bacterium]|nr:glyoxalase [Pseudonocardiaceae bacterium]
MAGIRSLVLEVEDTATAEGFYKEAFDLGDLGDVVSVRESSAPTSGFRGFTVSLVVSQPGTV